MKRSIKNKQNSQIETTMPKEGKGNGKKENRGKDDFESVKSQTERLEPYSQAQKIHSYIFPI